MDEDKTRLTQVEFSGPAGRLEGLVNATGDEPARAIAVLAHPLPSAGGTMHTKTVFHTAKALARIGCPVLRVNFRGVGRSQGQFDDGPGEMADYQAALNFMAARYPEVKEIWAVGVSFGGWIAPTVGARDSRVTALLAIAAPVNRRDFGPVLTAAKPVFLIHGERDEIIPLREVRKFYGRLSEPKELAVIDAADHLFDGKLMELGDAVEDLLQDFPEAPRDGKPPNA
jgi:alpha/beta superfamily hydrolase